MKDADATEAEDGGSDKSSNEETDDEGEENASDEAESHAKKKYEPGKPTGDNDDSVIPVNAPSKSKPQPKSKGKGKAGAIAKVAKKDFSLATIEKRYSNTVVLSPKNTLGFKDLSPKAMYDDEEVKKVLKVEPNMGDFLFRLFDVGRFKSLTNKLQNIRDDLNALIKVAPRIAKETTSIDEPKDLIELVQWGKDLNISPTITIFKQALELNNEGEFYELY